ncbi:MAG: phosphatase PAP2 family protein [Bacilli bacterium]|nr:phosphatase PAP2 family protein [Bacilli bacterium]
MKNRLLLIPAVSVVIILLIVGSFCDLQIAQGIYLADNGFSHFMSAFTFFPICFMGAFMCGNLLRIVINKRIKVIWANILLVVISVGLLVYFAYFMGSHITTYHSYNLPSYLAIPIGLPIVVVGYLLGIFFFHLVDSHNLKQLFIIYAFLVVLAFASNGLILLIKYATPRLRYTSVIDPQMGADFFRPWYAPDYGLKKYLEEAGIKLINSEETASFPSGHAEIALVTAFILIFIPKIFNRFKNREVYFFYGGFIFFLLVAFSRMLIGAHYLSDTMFAGLICLALYFIANEVYLRKLNQGGNL